MRPQNLKCLLLSPFFFPEPISTGKYNGDLAASLRDRGHAITVISSHPLYPSWVPHKTKEELPGVRVIRGGSWMKYPSIPALRRLFLELWYLCFLAYELPQHSKTTRGLVAVFPPVFFLPLAKALLSKNVPVVGIVHDLQSVFVEKGSRMRARFLGRIVSYSERKALIACDRLVFLSESMKSRAIAMHGIEPTKCCVYYPFATRSVFESRGGTALEGVFPQGFRHVVYSGALGEKQNPEGLLNCFVALKEASPQIYCHIFSRGPAFEALKRQHKDVDRLAFHDLVAEADLAELLERSDVQIVPQAAGTSEAALPSKLPNLIAAGVPILVIGEEDTEVGKIVREAGAGVVVKTWNPEDFVASALALLEAVKDEARETRRARAERLVHDRFSLDALADDLTEFLRQKGLDDA